MLSSFIGVELTGCALCSRLEVYGISKKGKSFFHIATFMAEPIKSMYVRYI
jgi:hypothetical protein